LGGPGIFYEKFEEEVEEMLSRWGSYLWMVLLLLFCFLWVVPLSAQETPKGVAKMEEVVVTATRVKEEAKTLPVSSMVITEKEIKATGFETVSDLLRYVEGFYIQATGGPGRATSLRIRGLDSRWVMVMVDGMEVNDPSTIGGAFDFSDLSVDNIERIEIVRGPESPLYGSDAMAGVINIITKTGKGKPSVSLSGYMGSMDTWQTRFSSSGKVGLLDYSLSASHMETNGIAKDDRYWRGSYAVKIGADLLENLHIEGTFRFINGDAQYDDFDSTTYKTKNDPNQYQKTDRLITTFTATYIPFEFWESQLKLGMSDTRRKYSDKWDPESTDHSAWSDILKSRSSYTGRIKKIDWQNTFHVMDRKNIKDILVVGYEYREDEGKSTYYSVSDSSSGLTKYKSKFPFRRMQLIGYYAQNELKLWDSLTLLAGFRIEDPDDFGGRTTYNLGASYYLKATDSILKVRYATGYKAPSLYELYAPPNPAWFFLGGNRDLSPEEGESYELGLTQFFFSKRIVFDFTFFHEAIDKKILWHSDPVTFESTYKNISTVVDQGIEAGLTLRPFKGLLLKANYTYTDPDDREHHRRVERVPLNQWSASVFYNWKDKIKAYLGARFVGDRVDTYRSNGSGHPKPYYANAYTVVNGKISYQVCPHFEMFLRGENMLNRDYEEVKGYEAPHAQWYLGGKVRF
jgi:vitamin B12 transporter